MIHSTVKVETGLNKPPVPQVRKALEGYPTYDRTTINSREDVEFRKADEEAGRRKLIMTALWTEACRMNTASVLPLWDVASRHGGLYPSFIVKIL